MESKIIKKAVFPEFYKEKNMPSNISLDMLKDVDVKLEMKIGEAVLPIGEIQKISPGYLIPLNKDSTEVLIDIMIDNKKLAKGEVVVTNDEVYIRVVNIVKS